MCCTSIINYIKMFHKDKKLQGSSIKFTIFPFRQIICTDNFSLYCGLVDDYGLTEVLHNSTAQRKCIYKFQRSNNVQRLGNGV